MVEVDVNKALRAFAKAVNKDLDTGRASERSFYPALEALIESCGEGIDAQIETAGRRDIVDITVKRGENPARSRDRALRLGGHGRGVRTHNRPSRDTFFPGARRPEAVAIMVV